MILKNTFVRTIICVREMALKLRLRMLSFLVRPPTGSIGKREITIPAFERHLARMYAFVLSDQHTARKQFAAHKATERLFARVRPNVLLQCVSFHIGATAYVAFIRFIHCMRFHVRLEYASGEKGLRAQRTRDRFDALVVAPMVVECRRRVECVAADLADVRIERCMRVGVLFVAKWTGCDVTAHVAHEIGG